ncbi:GNAT family N-acetyltransferase [Agriterribacter sp.]|uniref:GNAT family N-acetyltransferase n=1 Tax=Agriterribacter sp. TaxID=2821509 RepID=UPI002B53A03B|nr:GNAT family N-acetyltransferase [Agriterribacter sp.]HRP56212.1 GNAT family N-acetyltransferase [Agriterribacter sp.]
MRVTLRTWQKKDRPALAALANNIRIWNNVRDRLPHPYTIQHAGAFIKYCRKQDPPHILAIEVNGQLGGCIGLELQDDVSRISAELGYWIGEPYWGRGVATEAVKQMLEYTFDTFPVLSRIYAKVFEYNKASMKVLERNGFQLESIRKRSAIKNNEIIDEHVWVKFR